MAKRNAEELARWEGEGAYGYRTGIAMARRPDGRIEVEEWGFSWRRNEGGAGGHRLLWPAGALDKALPALIACIRGEMPLDMPYLVLDLLSEAELGQARRTKAWGFRK